MAACDVERMHHTVQKNAAVLGFCNRYIWHLTRKNEQLGHISPRCTVIEPPDLGLALKA